MVEGFKSTTALLHNSGGAQKDKAGVAFVSPEEVKEKRGAGMANSTQSKAVEGVQKNEDGTMTLNEAGHSNCFHCGSKYHWAQDCDQMSKTQRQSLYAAKPG